MTASASAKKDVQRLQRAIVDGLEDVKGQDIVVFDTETLSPLFERVIIASGTSNRQTRALAASVRDAVREAGFDKPRIEGEENGEWIIVDCGAAVAHVMQPVIRQYYRLEEIWGGKAVRLKHGAPKPVVAEAKPAAKKSAAKKRAGVAAEKPVAPVSAKTVVRKQAKARASAAAVLPVASELPKRAAAKAPAKTAKPSTSRAATKTVGKVAAKAPAKAPTRTATRPVTKTAAKAPARAPAKTATQAPVKTVVVKPKTAAKTAPKTSAKPAVKVVAKRAPGRKKT
jgi:ribosome-associated protein